MINVFFIHREIMSVLPDSSPSRPPKWIWIILVPGLLLLVGVAVLLHPFLIREVRIRRLESLGVKLSFSQSRSSWAILAVVPGLSRLGAEFTLIDVSNRISPAQMHETLELIRGLDVPISLLDLSHAKITGDNIRILQGLELRGLCLADSSIQDTDLQQIPKLSHLTYLALDQSRVTDDGLKHLHSMTNLTSLSLSQTEVSDAGISDLCRANPHLNVTDD